MYVPKFVKAGARNAVAAMQVDGPKAGKLVSVESQEVRQDPDDDRHGRKQPKEERKLHRRPRHPRPCQVQPHVGRGADLTAWLSDNYAPS